MIEIDVRGLSCPLPVAKTAKFLDENPGDGLVVLAGDETARDNIIRMAQGRGLSVTCNNVEDGYRLELGSKS